MSEHSTMTDTGVGEPQAEISGSGGSAIPAEELQQITQDIVGALKTVYDPEIPCDIYELGLIYKVDIEDDRSISVDMTLTAPGCDRLRMSRVISRCMQVRLASSAGFATPQSSMSSRASQSSPIP